MRLRNTGLLWLTFLWAGCEGSDVEDRVDPCPPGEEGCVCAASPACLGDLVCDATERLCRAPVECEDLQCPPHRLCVDPSSGDDAHCSEDCEAGWAWSARSGICSPLPPSCSPEAVTSIVAECEAANRMCVEFGGRGRCTDCLAGYVPGGEPASPCVEAPVCTDDIVAACAGEGRGCRHGECAGCLTGYLTDGEHCVAMNCGGEGVPGGIGETCASQLRVCETLRVEGPTGAFDSAECGACAPGHLPIEAGEGACRPVDTCATLACHEVRRLCAPGGADADAECGACYADQEEVGGRCAPLEGAFCEGEGDLTEACAAQGRGCDPAGPLGARCGDCLEGRVEHPETTECVEPMDCLSLGCDGQGRQCTEEPTAVCTECLPELVEDATGVCRVPLTCGDLACGRLDCAEAPMGVVADAQCVTPCREDQLWNGRICAPCPPCDGVGEAGRVARPTLAGWCVCQTEPGYFYSIANEVGAVPCDADGDGWVRESARLIFDSGDPVLIENARCALREIDRVVLHTEADQQTTTVLDGPLDLYESVRNDDERTLREEWRQAGLPTAAWGLEGLGMSAGLINPFTKLCHSPRADYNDNGVADVYEFASAPLAPGFRPEHQPFNTYSYFLELHRGWFEPLGADPQQGAWHIAERSRDAEAPDQVPIRYAGEADWWRSCARRADPKEPDPPVGQDFRAEGLGHHSQFKCVVVRDVPDEAQPLEMTPSEAAAHYELNDCLGEGAPVPAEGANPAEPRSRCAPRVDLPPPGTALWGAVPYTAYQSNPDHTGYDGGCVNTCAEAMYRHARDPADLLCPGLPVNVPSCIGVDADFGRLGCLEVACDQIDNDGDGETDEDPPATCPTGLQGVCATGSPRCEGTALVCDAPAPTEEVCDGLDNDCDGTIDEDTEGIPCAAASPSTGLPAEPGLPGVCGVRVTHCIAGVLDCLPTLPYEPEFETRCDGLDNNCDGRVDEELEGNPVPGQPPGTVVGEGCQDLEGRFEGVCAQTSWQCRDGEVVCHSAVEASPEGCPPGSPANCLRVCDGVDNDCDGETDEEGACERRFSGSIKLNPLLRAADTHYGPSAVTMNVDVEFTGQGTEEITATLQVEALEQYHTPTEAFGEASRSGRAEGVVARYVGGQRFSLTYIDRDTAPDLLKAPPIDPANNHTEPNVQEVDDHDAVTHLTCRGTTTDEDVLSARVASFRTDRTGCEVKFDLRYEIVPAANPCFGPPSTEVCDGIDNDCDGIVDERDRGVPGQLRVFFGRDTTFDREDRIVAILADGRELVVLEDAWLGWWGPFPNGSAIGIVVPGNVLQLRFEDAEPAGHIEVRRIYADDGALLHVPEDLRSLDAGQTSERVEYTDSLGLGQVCGSEVGACVPGVRACQDGAVVCANGVEPRAEPQACDGVDDNCDGEADELVREPCDSDCGRGTQGCAAGSECKAECEERCGVVGFRSCAPGADVFGSCQYDFPEEICDGQDNNCDGQVDEGFLIDEPCLVGEGACEAAGVWGCTADAGEACSAVPGEPSNELCDGLDNDCDGVVDNLTAPLADNQAGVCAGARQACEGEGGFVEPDYTAVADYEADELSCDGLDNDCDGEVDEPEVLEEGALAALQDGVCRDARLRCVAGAWEEPDYTAVAGHEESETTCDDGSDNDCDGQTDGADPDCAP